MVPIRPGTWGSGASPYNFEDFFYNSPMVLQGKKGIENSFCPLKFANIPGPLMAPQIYLICTVGMYYLGRYWFNTSAKEAATI